MADVSVRPAHPADSAAIGAIQARAWAACVGLLPADVLDGLDDADLAEQWRVAVTVPPSARHHVLVACAGRAVVGFAALGPGADPDLDPAADAELHALAVDPDAAGLGHGSRLLAATVDRLRADGFSRASSWLLEGDDGLRGFLAGAGWAADGAHRTLDLRGDGAVTVAQLRLHTDVRPDRDARPHDGSAAGGGTGQHRG